MFYNPLTEYEILNTPGRKADPTQALSSSVQLYWRVRSRSVAYQIWGILTRRPTELRELADATAGYIVQNRHSQGVQPIPLRQIRGSESRHADFDNRFYPTQEHTRVRWLSVATAIMLGMTLPPIEVIRIGDEYFVRDGHHRISVALALGQYDIDAEVTVWDVVATAIPAANACLSLPPT